MRTILTIGTLLFYSLAVNACRCVGTESVKRAFKNSELILSIKVIEVLGINERNDTTILANGDTSYSRPVFGFAKRVDVISVYKGKDIKQNMIVMGVDNSCEIHLEPGRHYLIYGRMVDGEIYTYACTRSALLKDNPDVEYLEKRRKPKTRSLPMD